MNAYGSAMTLAAIALEALGGREVRLCWCVDLERDIGPHADDPIDPTNPTKVETHWGALLQRFRDRLEAQPHEGQAAKLGMYVRMRLQSSSGQRVQCSYRLPYGVKVGFVALAKPPVGCWYLEAFEVDRTGGKEGDLIPDSFWYTGIPF